MKDRLSLCARAIVKHFDSCLTKIGEGGVARVFAIVIVLVSANLVMAEDLTAEPRQEGTPIQLPYKPPIYPYVVPTGDMLFDETKPLVADLTNLFIGSYDPQATTSVALDRNATKSIYSSEKTLGHFITRILRGLSADKDAFSAVIVEEHEVGANVANSNSPPYQYPIDIARGKPPVSVDPRAIKPDNVLPQLFAMFSEKIESQLWQTTPDLNPIIDELKSIFIALSRVPKFTAEISASPSNEQRIQLRTQENFAKQYGQDYQTVLRTDPQNGPMYQLSWRRIYARESLQEDSPRHVEVFDRRKLKDYYRALDRRVQRLRRQVFDMMVRNLYRDYDIWVYDSVDDTTQIISIDNFLALHNETPIGGEMLLHRQKMQWPQPDDHKHNVEIQLIEKGLNKTPPRKDEMKVPIVLDPRYHAMVDITLDENYAHPLEALFRQRAYLVSMENLLMKFMGEAHNAILYARTALKDDQVDAYKFSRSIRSHAIRESLQKLHGEALLEEHFNFWTYGALSTRPSGHSFSIANTGYLQFLILSRLLENPEWLAQADSRARTLKRPSVWPAFIEYILSNSNVAGITKKLDLPKDIKARFLASHKAWAVANAASKSQSLVRRSSVTLQSWYENLQQSIQDLLPQSFNDTETKDESLHPTIEVQNRIANRRYDIILPDLSRLEGETAANASEDIQFAPSPWWQVQIQSKEPLTTTQNVAALPSPLRHDLSHLELFDAVTGELIPSAQYIVQRQKLTNGYYIRFIKGTAVHQHVHFSAGFKSEEHSDLPAGLKKLSGAQLAALAPHLKEAGFSVLANSLKELGTLDVDVRYLADLIARTSDYNKGDPDHVAAITATTSNPFSPLAGYTCDNGRLQGVCREHNAMLTTILNLAFANQPGAHCELRAVDPVTSTPNGQKTRIGEGHAVTMCMYEGESYYFDATSGSGNMLSAALGGGSTLFDYLKTLFTRKNIPAPRASTGDSSAESAKSATEIDTMKTEHLVENPQADENASPVIEPPIDIHSPIFLDFLEIYMRLVRAITDDFKLYQPQLDTNRNRESFAHRIRFLGSMLYRVINGRLSNEMFETRVQTLAQNSDLALNPSEPIMLNVDTLIHEYYLRTGQYQAQVITQSNSKPNQQNRSSAVNFSTQDQFVLAGESLLGFIAPIADHPLVKTKLHLLPEAFARYLSENPDASVALGFETLRKPLRYVPRGDKASRYLSCPKILAR